MKPDRLWVGWRHSLSVALGCALIVSCRAGAPSTPVEIDSVSGFGSTSRSEATPRLGVTIAFTVAAPDMPDHLVGKVLVAAVEPNSVAQKAGMLSGDILLDIAGFPISLLEDVPKAVAEVAKGVPVEILILRRGESRRLKALF